MLFCFALLQNIKEYKRFIKPKASPGMRKAMNLPFLKKKTTQTTVKDCQHISDAMND